MLLGLLEPQLTFIELLLLCVYVSHCSIWLGRPEALYAAVTKKPTSTAYPVTSTAYPVGEGKVLAVCFKWEFIIICLFEHLLFFIIFWCFWDYEKKKQNLPLFTSENAWLKTLHIFRVGTTKIQHRGWDDG